MSVWDTIINNLPEVAGPTQQRLSFKEKLKWTTITLLLFFVLGVIPLFGLGDNQLMQFELLSLILGASFGSIISLGIGPMVTASIVLQLLNGSGLIKFDLESPAGKKRFQGVQKILSLFFIIFEAFIYVFMGGLGPSTALVGTPMYTNLRLLLVAQLIIGGSLIMFMDEVISKWGFGSGISLFIAAGVSQNLFVRLFSPLHPATNPDAYVGAFPELIRSLSIPDIQLAGLMIAGVIATVLVFVIAVYAQAMKIEIPLSFGRIRGHGVRWPLSFIYTSNIPVILIAALIANLQLWARLLERANFPILGTFVGNSPAQWSVIWWVTPPNILRLAIQGNMAWFDIARALVYMSFLIGGSIVFSIFWVQTAGMDSRSQAKQIMNAGLQIPGFRKDQRVLERLLNRYIQPLTVMGAIAVGFLASLADVSGALTSGTGLLLAVMIIYKLYEEIAKQHMMDMHPALRKFME